MDSTRLRVCDNRRISSHRVFVSEAGCSKTSMGWFGFKLHLVINEQGEILDVELTPGNTDDRRPLPKFAEGLHGNLYADRGYISKDLREQLRAQGINLVYKVRKNMKPLHFGESVVLLLYLVKSKAFTVSIYQTSKFVKTHSGTSRGIQSKERKTMVKPTITETL